MRATLSSSDAKSNTNLSFAPTVKPSDINSSDLVSTSPGVSSAILILTSLLPSPKDPLSVIFVASGAFTIKESSPAVEASVTTAVNSPVKSISFSFRLVITAISPALSAPFTPARLKLAPPVELAVRTILPVAVPEKEITSEVSVTINV